MTPLKDAQLWFCASRDGIPLPSSCGLAQRIDGSLPESDSSNISTSLPADLAPLGSQQALNIREPGGRTGR